MTKTPITRPKTPSLLFHRGKSLYYCRLSGVVHYLGNDRAEAQRRHRVAVGEWLSRDCQPLPPAPEVLTVTELVARHRSYAKRYYAASPKNLERITGSARPWVDLYGPTPIGEFTPASLRTVRDEMIRMNWSRGYCNTATNTIRRIVKWGVSEGLVKPELLAALECLEPLRRGFTEARETAPREGADLSDIEAIKEHLPRPVYDAARVLYLCGARPSEVLMLRVGDIDRQDPDVWRAVLERHKCANIGKSRVLFFGKAAQAILRPYMLKGATAYVFDPRESMEAMRERRNAERVTPDSCGNGRGTNVKEQPERNPGEHYEACSFLRAITRAIAATNKARKEKGLDPVRTITPYMLRHGRALELRAKEGLDAVAAVLGHAHLRMAEHYGKISEAQARGVASRLG